MKKLLLVLTVVSMAALLFTGCLPSGNQLPVITSTPVTTATIGTAYAYTVTATDADVGDTLTYTVVGPTGMVIGSATGVISGWTPATAGTFAVTVTVSDGTDSVTQSFTIIVEFIPGEITITVAGEYIDTRTKTNMPKTYVKGGSREITVTFPAAITDIPVIKVGTAEVPVFSTDNKIWKGSHKFTGDSAKLITVSEVCGEDICAAKSVIVDSSNPYAELKAKVAACACDTGWKLTITSDWTNVCEPACCGDDDDGSGLASWNVKIYDGVPWEECCDPSDCFELVKELDGTACQVEITTDCIDEVFVPGSGGGDGYWKDFFDWDYYVIATLTDNVGNEITYYGKVENTGTWDYADKATAFDSFIELVYDPTSLPCICYAEDPDAADKWIGDCDGSPATTCWAARCPVVELEPEVPAVGQEVKITIDYSDAIKPDNPAVYVAPNIKILPFGIPEDALELVMGDPVGDVYTILYTFEQAGSGYIYVTDDCEDCTPCKYPVTVVGDICPISCVWIDAPEFDGETYLKGGETYEFALRFNYEISELEMYDVVIIDKGDQDILSQDEIVNWGLIFTREMTLADLVMTTWDTDSDGITDIWKYTGTFTPPSIADEGEYCTEAVVVVSVLEPDYCCSPCRYEFNVDATLPRAYVWVEAVDCCGLAFLEFTSLHDCGDCCGDTCTELVEGDIYIYDEMPVWDCCDLQSTPAPICHYYDACPIMVTQNVLCAYCCLDTGDYWIITTLEDTVGNVNNYYDKITISGSTGNWLLELTEYAWTCNILVDGDASNPFIDGTETGPGAPAAIVTYGDSVICPF